MILVVYPLAFRSYLRTTMQVTDAINKPKPSFILFFPMEERLKKITTHTHGQTDYNVTDNNDKTVCFGIWCRFQTSISKKLTNTNTVVSYSKHSVKITLIFVSGAVQENHSHIITQQQKLNSSYRRMSLLFPKKY